MFMLYLHVISMIGGVTTGTQTQEKGGQQGMLSKGNPELRPVKRNGAKVARKH
jgi:hypothetical protein